MTSFWWIIGTVMNLRLRRTKQQSFAGLIVPEIQEDGKVKVDMVEPVLKAVGKSELSVDGVTWFVSCVSMGNPQCVTFGTKGGEDLEVDALNLAQIGPKFEHHHIFPARTNSGATQACGTGACATVVAAVSEGCAGRNCTVDLPGGPLEIEWREEDNHVYLTGPDEVVFYGSVPL